MKIISAEMLQRIDAIQDYACRFGEFGAADLDDAVRIRADAQRLLRTIVDMWRAAQRHLPKRYRQADRRCLKEQIQPTLAILQHAVGILDVIIHVLHSETQMLERAETAQAEAEQIAYDDLRTSLHEGCQRIRQRGP